VTCRIGIDVVAIELYRTQRQHSRSRRCNVLDHDVKVKLLRYCGIGPGGRLVTWGKLECQTRGRIAGGEHHPVVVTVRHPQPEQRGVKRGQVRGVWAVQDHMVHPPDHAADHARHGLAVRPLPGSGGLLGPVVHVADLGLSLCGRVQDWLHVEDGRSVEGFEVIYENAQARNGKDLNAVQADRVWPVR